MHNNSSKKKVLFVITKSNFGGAQKYVYELATGLPTDKFEAVVALGGEGLLVSRLQTAGIRTISLPSLMRDVNPIKDILSLISLFKLFLAERPDVVHLNSAKVSGLGAVAARLSGVPKIVFTAHGWAFNEDRSPFSRKIITFFSWVTVLLSHKTIAVSDAVRRDASTWPIVQDKIVVIKNGIRRPEFFSRDEARSRLFARAGIELDPNALVMGTIAELHRNKGLSYAVEAFAELSSENPNLYYFILGGGEEEQALTKLIQKYKLYNRLFLLGFTEDAAKFLPALDIFLLPSITEGLALVLLEAGFASLPVAASSAGGIPEVIEDEVTGLLFPPRDPDAILRAVTWILKSSTLGAKLGEQLYKRIIESFSFDRVISETTALYIGN